MRHSNSTWALITLLAGAGCVCACAPDGSSRSSTLENGQSPNGDVTELPTEEPTEGPSAGDTFVVKRLVSNDAKLQSKIVDPLLKNPWGLAAGPATFWWIANNGTNSSTLYDGEGAKQSLEVMVKGAPTGLVFNDGTGFVVSSGAASGASRFIFAAEDGTISGWSPAVPPPAPSKEAIVAFSASGAIYMGLALMGGRLYVTDFHNSRIQVLDDAWQRVSMDASAFVDPEIPAGYGPFGIRAVDDMIVVTYAKQDADREDDVKGAGFGFVDAFDATGALKFRIAKHGTLNAPWGLAMAPAEFGSLGGMLLVGNFGDGRIHAYDLARCGADGCADMGALKRTSGDDIAIEGLWALDFGKGNTMTGDTDELYFTAGPNDEADGLFGYIEPSD